MRNVMETLGAVLAIVDQTARSDWRNKLK